MRASRIVSSVLVLFATSPLAIVAQIEGGEGSKPNLFELNAGLSVWIWLVFALLVFLLGKFAWKPILGALEAREKGIQDALDEAAQRNAEAAGLLEEHKQQLADARRQANEILAEGKAAGERVRKEIEEKARVEGQAIVERARQEIERERDAAVAQLRRESVDLALAAASKLLSENLTQAKDRRLVEQFLDQMDDGRGARA
jgi:F-type H+-transporting ATPase subunit b